MADVSTAISVFNFALDCFGRIQLARQFEKQFGAYQLKLDIVQIRLSRWGEVAGIAQIDEKAEANGEKSPEASAKQVLEEIEDMLYSAQREAQEMEEKECKGEVPLDPNSHVPRDLQKIRGVFKKFLEKRKQQAVKAVESLKWAFYKKEHFETFITDINGLIKTLEELFPAEENKAKLRELSSEECKAIGKTNLKSLKPIVKDCDPWLEEAVEAEFQKKASGETTYNINMSRIKGTATGVHNGNVNGQTIGDGSRTYNRF
ncbi:prion-inhibition and propagation-domain-containing protein [Phyllosticta capitalensis]